MLINVDFHVHKENKEGCSWKYRFGGIKYLLFLEMIFFQNLKVNILNIRNNFKLHVMPL